MGKLSLDAKNCFGFWCFGLTWETVDKLAFYWQSQEVQFLALTHWKLLAYRLGHFRVTTPTELAQFLKN